MVLLCAQALAGDGALARVGETLGGAVVTAVEVHPEYERYTLEKEGRGLFEVTTGAGGLCDHEGLTIFPRPELLEQPGNAPGVDAVATALCERLAASPPRLRERHGAGEPVADGATGSPGRVEVDGPIRWGPLHGALVAVLGCLATLAWQLRRGAGGRWGLGLGLTALAALVRVLYAPVGVGNGNVAGYEKLVFARGTLVDTPYGAGWGTLMGLVPGWPDGVFQANLVFASITVGVVSAIAGMLAGEDGGPRLARDAPLTTGGGTQASLAAGVFLAFLPVHVGVSATETMHVSVGMLLSVAVLAALHAGRDLAPVGALAAALAVGLAVNVRPDAVLAVPAVVGAVAVGWTLARRRPARAWAAAIVVSASILVALVLHALHGTASASALGPPDVGALLPRLGAPGAERSFQLFLHAGFTPPVLWGLALFGLAALRKRPWVAMFLLAWALSTTVPLAGKVLPLVDAVRLQLGGQAPWVVLAAIGVAALPRWATVAALLSFLLYFPLKPWVQTEEWTYLRRVVPTLSDATVYYPSGHQREGAFAAVMEHIGPARWSGGPPPPDGLRYVGLECRLRPTCPVDGEPVDTVELGGRVDVDVQLTDRTIGFWR